VTSIRKLILWLQVTAKTNIGNWQISLHFPFSDESTVPDFFELPPWNIYWVSQSEQEIKIWYNPTWAFEKVVRYLFGDVSTLVGLNNVYSKKTTLTIDSKDSSFLQSVVSSVTKKKETVALPSTITVAHTERGQIQKKHSNTWYSMNRRSFFFDVITLYMSSDQRLSLNEIKKQA